MAEDLDIESLLEEAYKKKDNEVAVSINGENGSKYNGSSSKDKELDEHSKSKKDSKKKKERSRSRSRDRDRKRSSKKRSRSRDRKRSRDRRHSRSRSRERRHRDRKRSKTKEKTPELTPEERDVRTVFCMQLAARIRPRDLEEFFSSVGIVRDVRLITDPRTKRSKGIAYVEFKEVDSVSLAIGLSGQRLLGVPILVKPTQAEKNRIPGPVGPNKNSANQDLLGPMKLYVGSLHVNITEDMLHGIFEPFGRIEAINLVKDEFGRSKGYGFVQFSNSDDAKRAMEQLNSFELAGRPIKISHVTEKANESFGLANLDSDEMDRTGLNLGTSGKLALMAKLAEGTGLKLPKYTLDALNMATAAAAVASQAIYQQEASGAFGANSNLTTISTQCLMISNMFDIVEESKRDNWVEDIADDVIDECAKYGGITHIFVDSSHPDGNVYVKAPTISIAIAIASTLNGRYFGGKVIQTNFIPVANYHQLFPDSYYAQQILQTKK